VLVLPVLHELLVTHPLLPDEERRVLVQAVGVAADLVLLDLHLADEPRPVPDVEELVDVLAGLPGLPPVGVVVPRPLRAERVVQRVEFLEVQLRYPVELGRLGGDGADRRVLDDALDLPGDRRVLVLPVLHELLVAHARFTYQ
jgi:hypothetical protein